VGESLFECRVGARDGHAGGVVGTLLSLLESLRELADRL
jgi:hypothetical protein